MNAIQFMTELTLGMHKEILDKSTKQVEFDGYPNVRAARVAVMMEAYHLFKLTENSNDK